MFVITIASALLVAMLLGSLIGYFMSLSVIMGLSVLAGYLYRKEIYGGAHVSEGVEVMYAMGMVGIITMVITAVIARMTSYFPDLSALGRSLGTLLLR